MSSLAFLCILRDSGQATADLCADIAHHARPGDQVILIDDGGPGVSYHTSTIAAEFGAMQGWPQGVRVKQVSTGTRGRGDAGIAINLALALATTDHLMLLPGTGRLTPALAAARTLAATCDMLMPPIPSVNLSTLIIRRTWAQDLRCAEGTQGSGPLSLLAALTARQGVKQITDTPFAQTPPPPPVTPDWLALWQTLPDPLAQPLLAEALQTAAIGTRALIASITTLSTTTPPTTTPPLTGRAKLRVSLQGRHAPRSPLSYPALTPLWSDTATLTSDPNKADLILFAHPWDIRDMDDTTARAIEAQPQKPRALLSEEPFWDSLFSPAPLAEDITLETARLGRLTLHQRNHHNSPIFDFARIPYFLLTDPAFATRYALAFARNAARTPQDWQTAFAGYATQATFMAERRLEPFHNLHHPGGDVTGLCTWRTELALAYTTAPTARIGASWDANAPPRQALDDWHADKLATLTGTTRLLSGVENTHQPTYLSEKLFDAFACGARPLYYARPAHRIHGLGLPQNAWINLAGLTPQDAAGAIDRAPWDPAFFAAYAQAQSTLAALWTDPEILAAEHHRLGTALRADLHALAGAADP